MWPSLAYYKYPTLVGGDTLWSNVRHVGGDYGLLTRYLQQNIRQKHYSSWKADLKRFRLDGGSVNISRIHLFEIFMWFDFFLLPPSEDLGVRWRVCLARLVPPSLCTPTHWALSWETHDVYIVYLYSCSTSEWLPSNTIATIEYLKPGQICGPGLGRWIYYFRWKMFYDLWPVIGFYLAADYCPELAMPNSRVL